MSSKASVQVISCPDNSGSTVINLNRRLSHRLSIVAGINLAIKLHSCIATTFSHRVAQSDC